MSRDLMMKKSISEVSKTETGPLTRQTKPAPAEETKQPVPQSGPPTFTRKLKSESSGESSGAGFGFRKTNSTNDQAKDQTELTRNISN